jgi:hypothetical protein
MQCLKKISTLTTVLLVFAAPLAMWGADNGGGTTANAASTSADTQSQSGIDRPVSPQEVREAEDELTAASQPDLQIVGGFETHSGDALTALSTLRAGAQLDLRRSGDNLFYARVTDFQFSGNGGQSASAFNVTGGLKRTISDAASANFELGASRFSTGGSTVNGLATATLANSMGTTFTLAASRSNVVETMLSAAGVPAGSNSLLPGVGFGNPAGTLVGEVMDNRGTFGFDQHLIGRLDAGGDIGGGLRTGTALASDVFKLADAFAGYNVIADDPSSRLSLVRVSYQLNYEGFARDMLNGPVFGGYFSPSRYLSNVGQFDIRGNANPRLRISFSAFAGTQNYTGSAGSALLGADATLNFKINDRFSLPLEVAHSTFGPFHDSLGVVKLVTRF